MHRRLGCVTISALCALLRNFDKNRITCFGCSVFLTRTCAGVWSVNVFEHLAAP